LDIDIKDIKEKFGRQLKSIRIEKQLTQVTLGVKCGLDDSQISKLERGVWDIQLSTIVILAKGLDIEPKELLDFKI
jgi:transcriptional regulator with XRE-family HTH domain